MISEKIVVKSKTWKDLCTEDRRTISTLMNTYGIEFSASQYESLGVEYFREEKKATFRTPSYFVSLTMVDPFTVRYECVFINNRDTHKCADRLLTARVPCIYDRFTKQKPEEKYEVYVI